MKKLLVFAAAIHIMVISIIAQTGENPLVVVDGSIRNIRPGDIDPLTVSSVTVLKDQNALTAYGNAGKNGVIIVTTKGRERAQPEKEWKLIWEDSFDGNSLDTAKWTLINTKPGQRASDWNRHMINDARVYSVKDGSLYLTAIRNPGIENDPRPYLTGGVDSKGKFSFLYGKAEIRARKECAQGAWPALWMMPEEASYGGWPHSGEIDLMEHLNFDGNVHYNVHSRYVDVVKNKSNPKSGSSSTLADVTQWNVYGLEWSPDSLIWTLNGEEVFSYPKLEGSDAEQIQWPFDKPFYFILSQQLGGSWVGEVNPGQLPVSMIIDWVKVYQEK